MGRDVGPAFQRWYRDTPSSNIGVRALGNPAFAPRSGPHAAHAPGAQMIRMPAGRSLALQGWSRDTPNFNLSFQLVETE
eukprot:gene17358-biopygen3851